MRGLVTALQAVGRPDALIAVSVRGGQRRDDTTSPTHPGLGSALGSRVRGSASGEPLDNAVRRTKEMVYKFVERADGTSRMTQRASSLKGKRSRKAA